jgi:hypothetical protein
LNFPETVSNFREMGLNFPEINLNIREVNPNFPELDLNFPEVILQFRETNPNFPEMVPNFRERGLNLPEINPDIPEMNLNFREIKPNKARAKPLRGNTAPLQPRQSALRCAERNSTRSTNSCADIVCCKPVGMMEFFIFCCLAMSLRL